MTSVLAEFSITVAGGGGEGLPSSTVFMFIKIDDETGYICREKERERKILEEKMQEQRTKDSQKFEKELQNQQLKFEKKEEIFMMREEEFKKLKDKLDELQAGRKQDSAELKQLMERLAEGAKAAEAGQNRSQSFAKSCYDQATNFVWRKFSPFS